MSLKYLMQSIQAELIEKGSRFIGLALPCESLRDFKEYIKRIRSQYQDATHVTYAYRIQESDALHIKCHDDGEPSGTAGRPILNHIEGRDLTNTVVFVIRYFGGTKLGAGGLIRAYGNTAKETLSRAKIDDFIKMKILQLQIPYDLKSQFDYLMISLKARILDCTYGEKIDLVVQIPEKDCQAFLTQLGITLNS